MIRHLNDGAELYARTSILGASQMMAQELCSLSVWSESKLRPVTAKCNEEPRSRLKPAKTSHDEDRKQETDQLGRAPTSKTPAPFIVTTPDIRTHPTDAND